MPTKDMKALPFTIELKSPSDDGPGEFEAVMSTEDLDRDDEVLDFRAFDPLPDHITIDTDHGLSVASTVAAGRPFYADDGTLRVRGWFASTPEGQKVRTLVKEDIIRNMSVAYRAAKYETDEKDGKRHLRKGELVNAAFVGVPANSNAVITGVKVGARNSSKDQERIQNTHDHMVELGATCSGKCAHDVEPKFYTGPVTATSGYLTTTALVGTKANGQTFIFDMDGHELGRSVDTKSSADDPDGKAAAPAAATPPAPTLMADAYVALAKARMLQLDT